MRYIDDNIKVGEKGFVVHNFKVVEITVNSIVDISKHGSPYEVIYCAEISDEYFNCLLTEKEAYEKLLGILKNSKQTIQENIEKEKSKKRYIKEQIEAIKLKLGEL